AAPTLPAGTRLGLSPAGRERDGALAGGGKSTRLRHSPAGDQAARPIGGEDRLSVLRRTDPCRSRPVPALSERVRPRAGSGESGAVGGPVGRGCACRRAPRLRPSRTARRRTVAVVAAGGGSRRDSGHPSRSGAIVPPC